jgi:hypothetical protein
MRQCSREVNLTDPRAAAELFAGGRAQTGDTAASISKGTPCESTLGVDLHVERHGDRLRRQPAGLA